MRLYVVIPNYIFFEKVANNPYKFGEIVVDDLSGTYQDVFRYDLAPFLAYCDKEEFIDNSICCFTTPREAKTFLENDNIMLSFEADDNSLLFDADQFEKYLIEKSFLEDYLIENMEDFEKTMQVQKQINDFTDKNLSKVYKKTGYYDSFAVVENIPIISIKCFFASKNNKKIETLKNLKNINFEFVSSVQRGQENVLWYCKREIWALKK